MQEIPPPIDSVAEGGVTGPELLQGAVDPPEIGGMSFQLGVRGIEPGAVIVQGVSDVGRMPSDLDVRRVQLSAEIIQSRAEIIQSSDIVRLVPPDLTQRAFLGLDIGAGQRVAQPVQAGGLVPEPVIGLPPRLIGLGSMGLSGPLGRGDPRGLLPQGDRVAPQASADGGMDGIDGLHPLQVPGQLGVACAAGRVRCVSV